jgi:RNA polymerase sigma factor (sigma-70 family)
MAHAPADPEELLAHAAWLRRLAASLVRGDGDPDDLVQETWLAALKSPPAGDRPVRGWLAEVLKNARRMRARAAARRVKREAEIALENAGESAPSAEVLLGRLAAQRRLAELVAELPEPYRSAILLRYYEGLSAAEIARRLDVPAGTVRFRVSAGLDKLRAALDRESHGDRRAWCLFLAPLAGAKKAAPVEVVLAAIFRGIWAMSRAKKIGTVVVALVMLLGAAAVYRTSSRSSVTPETRASAPSSSAPASAAPSARAPLPPPRRGATLATVERDEAALHGVFEGRVISWSSGEGVPGAELTFSVDGATTSITADGQGRFRFTPPREGRCALATVTHPDYLPFAPEWGHSSFELVAKRGARIKDLTIQLVPALDYTGVVVDPKGRPVAGATVTLLGAGQGERALHPITDRFTSNDQGEITFHAPDYALLEASHPAWSPARARMDGPALTSHRLVIRLGDRGPDAGAPLGREKIAGRVVDPDGNAVAGALVLAKPRVTSSDDIRPDAEARSDASGAFSLEGLDAGAYSVLASAAGFATRSADAVSAGTLDLVLVLRRGSSLAGRVIDAKSRAPVPAFTVIVARREGAVKEVPIAVRSFVDADGRFAIPDLEPGDYRVRASAATHAPSSPLDATVADPPASGAPIEIALTRGARLTGTVVEREGGAPIPLARVSIESPFEASSAAPIVINAITDEHGDFELAGIPTGARSVMVGAYQHHIRILSGLRFEEDATAGPINVDLAKVAPGEEPRIELVGIGAQLRPDGDGLKIEKVFPGGGAAEVGLGPGDVILGVDGASVGTLGFDSSIQRIRGPEGSIVRLTVRRADGGVLEIPTPRRRLQT